MPRGTLWPFPATACRAGCLSFPPESMSRLEIFSAETLSALELPFADEGVRAGFPSPAQDYMEKGLKALGTRIVSKEVQSVTVE